MPEPWLKLSTSLLTNPKVMYLSSDLFKLWVCCLVEAKIHNEEGLLPAVGRLAYSFRAKPEQVEKLVERLIEERLVDRTDRGLVMHDWSHWQHVKPSATRAAIRERVNRFRAVTPRNTSGGVTANVTPVTPREQKRVEKKRGEESTPGSPSRGATIPPTFTLTDEMAAYAGEAGVPLSAAREHVENFAMYWDQATRNNTSKDWVKRWKLSLKRDIAAGRVKVGRPVVSEEEVPVQRTPAEESFIEALQYIAGVRSVPSPRTEAIATAAGGWDVVRSDAFDFPDWVAAWHQIGGGDGV